MLLCIVLYIIYIALEVGHLPVFRKSGAISENSQGPKYGCFIGQCLGISRTISSDTIIYNISYKLCATEDLTRLGTCEDNSFYEEVLTLEDILSLRKQQLGNLDRH